MNRSVESSHEIINCGKLVRSSYYDKPNKILSPEKLTFIDAPIIHDQPNYPVSSNDRNLFIRSCIFSPDESHLAWTNGYKIIKVMKYKQTNKLKRSFSTEISENELSSNNFNVNDIAEIDCNENVRSIAFGSSKPHIANRRVHFRMRKTTNNRFNVGDNNLLLAVGLVTGKIKIYDITCLSLCMFLFDHRVTINDLKFTQDGSLQLASASDDETIKLWNIYEDGNMYKTLKGHNGKVNMIDWSPKSKLICSVGINRQAYIWDTENFKLKFTLRGHLHIVSACQFSPDGVLLVTAGYDTKICIWNPYDGSLINEFGHMNPPPSLIYAGGANGAYVRDFSFSKNGDHLVSICDDKKIRVWSLSNKSVHPMAIGELKSESLSCAYSSDSRTVMVGTTQGHLDVYKVPAIIPSLIVLCRKVVNQMIEQPIELYLPNELKKFLQYDEIKAKRMQNTNPSLMSSMSSSSNLLFKGTALCN